MTPKEFNKKYNKNLRLIHYAKHREGFHFLAQWCPHSENYTRMWPSFVSCDKIHFDGFLIPEKLLSAVEEFESNGYQASVALIVKEKHGTSYFDASTVERCGCACLKLLNDRLDQGYYDVGDDPKKPKISVEQVSDSPTFKPVAEREWNSYRRTLKYNDRARKFIKQIGKCTESKSYFNAYSLLQSRIDYEYEFVTMESLTRVSPDEVTFLDE